jgi:hypothetical protein
VQIFKGLAITPSSANQPPNAGSARVRISQHNTSVIKQNAQQKEKAAATSGQSASTVTPQATGQEITAAQTLLQQKKSSTKTDFPKWKSGYAPTTPQSPQSLRHPLIRIKL